MASFADLSANLKLNIQDFARNLRTASGQVERFGANINGTTVDAMRELNRQTNAWGLNLKSVSIVVSGILISQAFYGMTQQISSATNAVWEFTKQLEYAQIAYSNLFGDTALATEFINVLKDFAARTPFSFTESEKAAKRLLAYGIEYKNVMYVMEGVMSAAAAQGDPARVEQISRAIGQIYTYGKLMTAEVRQLTEAGIPAYEILQEELGLTQDQLRNLGNEAIPASDAINALVDGITKRFGNVFDASSKTITGIISNIKDNATMLASGLTEPLTVAIKSALVEVGEFLYAMREMFELRGAGGVFEAIIPPELQDTFRHTAAILLTLVQAVMRLAMAIGDILKPVLMGLVTTFNALAPILINITNFVATLIQFLANNATVVKALTVAVAAASAMWVVFKVRALAAAAVTAVITGISKALAGLSAMLTFVVAHPFWALLIGLAGIVLGISGGFGKLSDSVNNFFKQITKFNGVDPDKILLPSQKERANDLDKFNNRLEGTSDAMDDLADSTGKATKAARGLLSFDEVFKLNEPDEGTGSGSGISDAGLEELLTDLSGIGGSFVPEVPDFSEYMNAIEFGFIDSLKEAWSKIKEYIEPIVSTAIGAGFGAVLGSILGGTLGGKIGMVAGAIAGYFWNSLADKFGLSADQKITAGIITGVGTGLGAIIGGVLGGPGGAKIGAAIGTLVGSIWGMFAESFGIVDEQHVATAISGALSGALTGGLHLFKELSKNLVPTYIDDVFAGFAKNAGFSLSAALKGGLKQGILGAVTSLGVGMLANTLTAWIADELSLTEQDLANSGVGQTIGNIVGSIAGLILGGPIGSLVGGALGQLAGSIVGEFWNYISTTFKGTIIGSVAGLPIGALVGTIVGSIGGPLGAAIGALVGGALGTVIGLVVDNWGSIVDFFSNVGNDIADAFNTVSEFLGGIGTSVGDTWNNISTNVSTALGNIGSNVDFTWENVFSTISNFLGGIGTNVSTAWNNVSSDTSTIFGKVWTTASNKWSDVSSTISGFLGDIKKAVSTVWGDIFKGLGTVLSDIFDSVSEIWKDIQEAIDTVLGDIWDAISTVWSDVFTAISTFLGDIKDAVSTVWSDIFDGLSKVLSDISKVVSEIWNFIKDLIVKIVGDIWSAISEKFTKILEVIRTKITDALNVIISIFSSIYNVIRDKITSVLSVITSLFTSIYNNIRDKINNALSIITSVFTSIYSVIRDKVNSALSTVIKVFSDIFNDIKIKVTNAYNAVKVAFSDVYTIIKDKVSNAYNTVKTNFDNAYISIRDKVSSAYTSVRDAFTNIYSITRDKISNMYTSVRDGISNIYKLFTNWISNMWNNVFNSFFNWLSNGISKLREFFNLSSSVSNVSIPSTSSYGGTVRTGHATGGIFDREHIARFAEGNKAEAVIPLENASAMQPFVDAISRGIVDGIAPVLVQSGGGSSSPNGLQPLYVGTLIADDRGLKQLYKKFELIQVQENARKGLT